MHDLIVTPLAVASTISPGKIRWNRSFRTWHTGIVRRSHVELTVVLRLIVAELGSELGGPINGLEGKTVIGRPLGKSAEKKFLELFLNGVFTEPISSMFTTAVGPSETKIAVAPTGVFHYDLRPK